MNTRKHRILTAMAAALLLVTAALGSVACTETPEEPSVTTGQETTAGTGDPADTTVKSDDTTTPAGDDTTAPEETTEEVTTEAVTESIKDQLKLEVTMADLDKLMQPIFSGTTSHNETVMFLDKGDTKSLLYPIESIQSVTSYDGKKVYEEGKDYVIVDGKLQVTENSTIPCITSAKYYNYSGSIINIMHNGKQTPIHWGEGQAMTNWQVNVNYTHAAGWSGYAQPSELEVYQNFVKKLQAGEDVTVFFYGDSITYGANASWINGYAPHQLSYPILFVQALADLFDYTVKFERPDLTSGMPIAKIPTEDYVAGDRGTITYVNTAIGGWTSENGVTNLKAFVEDQIAAYGCDLFVVGFGMNDAAVAPATTSNNVKKIVNAVLDLKPEASIALVSTMVPNPKGIGWYGNQDKQEAELTRLAKLLRSKGNDIAVCHMTSTSLAILKNKDFHDYSGNNINHPNDYFVRVYAQTLLQTIIGYENMN